MLTVQADPREQMSWPPHIVRASTFGADVMHLRRETHLTVGHENPNGTSLFTIQLKLKTQLPRLLTQRTHTPSRDAGRSPWPILTGARDRQNILEA